MIPIPEKSLGDKALNVINNMTLRQLAAVAGAKYDPLTGEEITPNERQLAKASMLGLGLTRTVSGVTRLTDDALIGIEKQYGKSIAEKLVIIFTEMTILFRGLRCGMKVLKMLRKFRLQQILKILLKDK